MRRRRAGDPPPQEVKDFPQLSGEGLRADGLPHLRQRFAPVRLGQGQQHVFLAGEVIVHRPGRDARLFGQPADVDRLRPFLGDDPARAVQQ